MSEKILKFLLDELKTVRLVCQATGCGAAIEFSCEHLQQTPTKCPVCGAHFFDVASDKPQRDYIKNLLLALHHLEFVRERVKIEFVMPDRDRS